MRWYREFKLEKFPQKMNIATINCSRSTEINAKKNEKHDRS